MIVNSQKKRFDYFIESDIKISIWEKENVLKSWSKTVSRANENLENED